MRSAAGPGRKFAPEEKIRILLEELSGEQSLPELYRREGIAANLYYPWDLAASLRDFVAYYNNECYHEAIDNVTPSDAYFGRKYAVVSEREKIKTRTIRNRKKEYLAAKAA